MPPEGRCGTTEDAGESWISNRTHANYPEDGYIWILPLLAISLNRREHRGPILLRIRGRAPYHIDPCGYIEKLNIPVKKTYGRVINRK